MKNFSKKEIARNRLRNQQLIFIEWLLKHLVYNANQSNFRWVSCKISFQDPSRYGKENVLLVIFYSRCWTFSNIINIHFLWRFTYSWLKNWLVGYHRDAFRYISHSTRIHQLLMFLNLRNPSFSRRVRSYSQWMRYRTKRKKRKISLTQFSKHRMNNNLICNRILRF